MDYRFDNFVMEMNMKKKGRAVVHKYAELISTKEKNKSIVEKSSSIKSRLSNA